MLPIRLCLIMLASTLLLGCPQNQPQPLVIVGNSWLGYQPFYAMEALHKSQLPAATDFIMLTSDNSVTRMVSNEAVHGSLLSLDNALALNSTSGIDYCIALALSFSNGADGVVSNPARFDLHAERPMVVGMEDSALARYMLERWLQVQALDRTKIIAQVITPNRHQQAFETGEVDAIITYQPFKRLLRQAGAELIFSSADIPGEIIDTLVVRVEAWQQHRAQFEKLFTSWDAALQYTLQPGSDEYQVLQRLSAFNATELSEVLRQLQFMNSSESEDFLRHDFQPIQQRIADYLQQTGTLEEVRLLPICSELAS